MKKLILGLGAAALIAPFAVDAATREFPFAFTQDCTSIEGDSLDSNGDGVCDGIDYWRFYTADNDDTNPGAFINSFALAEFDIDTTVTPLRYTCTLQTCIQKTRHNRDWGVDRCMQLTAVTLSVLDGTPQESAKSNVGACRDVDKGRPNPSVLENDALVSAKVNNAGGNPEEIAEVEEPVIEEFEAEPPVDPLEDVAVEEAIEEEVVVTTEEEVVEEDIFAVEEPAEFEFETFDEPATEEEIIAPAYAAAE